NMAMYLTVLKPGDTVMGLNLAHGGQLSHGHPMNFSGKYYQIVPIDVRQSDELIDYEKAERDAHRKSRRSFSWARPTTPASSTGPGSRNWPTPSARSSPPTSPITRDRSRPASIPLPW